MFNKCKVRIIPLLKVPRGYSVMGEESNSEVFKRDYVLLSIITNVKIKNVLIKKETML